MYNGKKISVIKAANDHAEMVFDAADALVNVFDEATVTELAEAITVLEQRNDIRGLLISSAKSSFIVGADIKGFNDSFVLPDAQLRKRFDVNTINLNRLEALPFPTVVAIDGYALGGGLVFCLACDYRVMSNRARIGLPETGLGIVPVWGGMVRLPRIATLGLACDWISSAQHHDAETALKNRVIDEVTSAKDLRSEAEKLLNYAKEHAAEVTQRRAIKQAPLEIDPLQADAEAAAVRAVLRRRMPHHIAPAAAVDLLVESANCDAKETLAREADLFIKLCKTDQARALIGNFLNRQHVTKVASDYAGQSTFTVKRVAVIGAGIMGGGIACQNALSNIPVVLKDIDNEALASGVAEASRLLDKRVIQGKLSEVGKRASLEKIVPTLDNGEIEQADLCIETVVEQPAIKAPLLAELDALLPGEAILCSNTSTISITRLASALQHPARFAGLHFFNPVPSMQLVEVIRAEATAEPTIAALVAYVLALGKMPVVVNDCPAFLVNRVLYPYLRAFDQLLLEGADYEQVDRIMQGWGWPMGPAWLVDVIGIDTVDQCMGLLDEAVPERMARLPDAPTHLLFAAGLRGQKTAAGFYCYGNNEYGKPTRVANDKAKALINRHIAASKKAAKANFSDEVILQRCMLPMAIEMSRCIEEKIVASAAEADMAVLYGIGMPDFRGGLLRWMDELGLDAICAMADRYRNLGEPYRPTEQMRAMASSGARYYA
ncbi:MAG: 3-hydroxyacyl-CoA dehydrogenase NAD-binding domain-containing protein [Pseudomonadales bacterium]